MVGLLSPGFRMERDNRTTLNENNWELRMEQVFSDLNRAVRLKSLLDHPNLNQTELALAQHQMNGFQSVSSFSSLRLESSGDLQQNLKLRLEEEGGILSSIWNKIAEFFKWISDKIGSIFDSDSVGSAEEAAKETPANVETVTKAAEEIRSNGGGGKKIVAKSLTKIAESTKLPESNPVKAISMMIESAAAIKNIADGFKITVDKLSNDSATEDEIKAVTSSLLEKIQAASSKPAAEIAKTNNFGKDPGVWYVGSGKFFAIGLVDGTFKQGKVDVEVQTSEINCDLGEAMKLVAESEKLAKPNLDLVKYMAENLRPASEAMNKKASSINKKTSKEKAEAIRGACAALKAVLAMSSEVSSNMARILNALKDPKILDSFMVNPEDSQGEGSGQSTTTPPPAQAAQADNLQLQPN